MKDEKLTLPLKVEELKDSEMGFLTGGFLAVENSEIGINSDNNNVCKNNNSCSGNGTCRDNNSCKNNGKCVKLSGSPTV